MTSTPEPDKLGRNMKALPSNCQKLADGIQQSWNRAIPENDYIQLGTLRYGVRLSNTGLLEGTKAGPGDPAPGDGNARGSINSYEINANGSSSVHSVGGTSSVSSGEQQNCCCIGSGGVEMPWANSYSRTKLPVPSSLAKNRKSSPTASAAGTPTTPTGSAAAGGGIPTGVDRQQQQQPRYPPLAPGRSSNGNCQLSQSTLSYGHGSDDDRGTVSGLVGLGYTNGGVHKPINGKNSHHHNNDNNNSHSYHNSNSSSVNANGPVRSQEVYDRDVAEHHHQQRFLLEELDQQQQQQQQPEKHETSPRCSTVVCCYSNSFGSGSNHKRQQKERSPEREPAESRNGRYARQQRRDRTIEFPREPAATGGPRADGAPSSVGGRIERRRLGVDLEGAHDADSSTVVNAAAHPFGGCESSGGTGGYREDDGDDLNLNSRNAPQQQHQRLHQVVQQRGWQQQEARGGKDVHINNFEKKKISSDPRVVGRNASSASGGGGGERSGRRQKQPSFIGSDTGADELSSTSSSVSPRSASPAVQQQGVGGSVATPDHSPGWCVPGSESPVCSTPPAQAHPPQVATPFGQRRRLLQPPSSLPVVKSYSFHRALGSDSPRSPGQLFDSVPPTDVGPATRNRSFRAANHARRLQYGYVDDSGGVERPNGTGYGAEASYHPHVARKSSLPVLGTSNGVASRYHHQHHLLLHHSLAGGGRSASTDECYPFDKSTCQPECVLTPRSHRKHPCSDAINEIRLQSLNKYCNQLLSATNLGPYVRGAPGSQPGARPIDELEDLCFIDSSDLSSAGDDTRDEQGRDACRTHPSIIAAVSRGGSLPTTEATAVDGGKTLTVVSGGSGRVVGVASTAFSSSSSYSSSPTVLTVGADGNANLQQHNHIDSSSDELSSVCEAADSGQRHNGHRYRAQCDRNDSNASDEYRAALDGADVVAVDVDEQRASASVAGGDRTHARSLPPGRHSDTNNNNNYRAGADVGGRPQQYHHQQQQQPHQQPHQLQLQPHQLQLQPQQKYTTRASNNSAVKSVSGVGGVGGVGPGRPGGVGEQTLPGRAATADESSTPPPYKLLVVGHAAAPSSPDSSPAHHAGLNCFGRSNTALLHAAGGSIADKSIMEKRNNTLDRLQRLVKKSTSGGSAEKQSNSGGQGGGSSAVSAAAGGSKTERLRELTELLKGNRAPPPVPPPRRPKHAHSVDRSFDRPNAALSTTSLINIDAALHGSDRDADGLRLKAKESRSVDIPYRFADSSGQRMSTPSSPLPEHKPVNLRANVSTSNLERLQEQPQAQPTPVGETECRSETALKRDDEELFAKLSRPESRTIVGSYTQKTIPFRSASFSQVDYSSGKYIRSALGALKSSLMKGKEQSSVDSSTLPHPGVKVETARSCSPTELCGVSEPADDTDVAKLTIKKTELSINLAPLDDYGRYFDERSDGKDLASNRNSDIETIVEDPVAEHIENLEQQCQANISVLEASEMVLESPVEEGIPITPSALAKDDECLQQATTCLIPVPVYDCVVSEWSTARPSEQWIDASMTEYGGRYSDALDSIKEVNEGTIGDVAIVPASEAFVEQDESSLGFHPEQIVVEQPPKVIEPQASLELSEDSGGAGSDEMLRTPPVSIICTEPESNEFTTIVDGTATHKVSVVLGEGREVEVVEVRKRHSNNEDTGDPQGSRLSHDGDEKRRLESRKSRRKGIYIQWPAIDGHSELESDNNDGGTPAGVEGEGSVGWNPASLGQAAEKDSSLDLSGESCTDLSAREPTDREHHALLDPTTPDSEDPGRPVWPKGVRRQSLTYQSSDEKDDTLPAPALPVRSLKTLFLRSDSVSDNESDRASSRDRTCASPAPGGADADLKRYSKRPLRGPYGQMLEAEMKKPTTKVQYNEILEELTRNEGHVGGPGVARHRGAASQSMDETNDRHSGKACKPRKTSANLPVPTHVRTSSSPSKLSDSSVAHTAPSTPSKRYLGNIEQRSTDSEKSDRSGVGSTTGSATGKLESKKLSLDGHLPDRAVRRGGSDGHEKLNKRSASSASDKQQKRSLDEVRLSQNSRTPSERSFTLHTPETPKGGLTASPELLAELLKGSSEKLITEQLTAGAGSGGANASNALPSAVLNCLDTRTHVVVELFNTEKSYVESLQTIVLKYLNQLKSPENSGLVDAQIVDEIFFMVPAILNIHERFLEELRRRLDSWDKLQMIGDAFVDVFSRPVILDTYTSFVNNWNRAKDAIRSARQKCPAFARFLEAMAREHKGKLSLDNLLIKPVQKFPNYELIFTRLIKHTDVAHPDQKPLQEALKLVHDILIFLNCKEKEALENGQRETALRELEGVIEGMNDLVTPERAFLLFDLVSMPSGQVTRKERGFFLFNDLLVITSIKRRSGTIRKTNMTCPGSVASTLDTNKYKYLTKISLDDLEIVKSKDENVRRIMKEIEHLTEDSGKLIQISDIAASLRCPHASLEETIRELQRDIQRQLAERQTNDAQLNVLELTWNTSSGIQNMTVVFSKPEKRTQWEEFFAEAKQKLASSMERSQIPEFFVSVPIRKTRAGLQFTCASPTLGSQKDVWVCNSDGYVGQVCVLSLVPEPSVTSCNGVCNARILCVASVPASEERPTSSALVNVNISIVDASSAGGRASKSSNSVVNSPCKAAERKGSFKSTDGGGGGRHAPSSSESNVQLDSGSSSEDSEAESQPERGAPSPSGASMTIANHRQQDSSASTVADGEPDNQQSTMWLGTEDGCIHVYNCTDNIRIKKNKIKIPHVSAVYSILYLDNRVFVSLANGDICVYSRDRAGWNVSSPITVTVGTVTNPVVKLLNVHGKLWCAIQGTIKVLNTKSLQIDSQIQISNDSKPITNMTVLNDFVWISVQNSAHIKCCHHESFEVIFEVNLAPSVNKMLSNCDDIIRQHKAACLRVTSLLACKDLIWVGTSAGVLLTIAAHSVAKGSSLPIVTGIPHGHTGHVRFLTYVESPDVEDSDRDGPSTAGSSQAGGKSKPPSQELLVISGGDGYEDFRSAGNNTMSEVAGREDSTNHLLLWKV